MRDEEVEQNLIYDVAHNIAKVEKHVIDGVEHELIVHRKGATRAFPPGSEEIPEKYRTFGQSVLIVVSYGTASYSHIGTEQGMYVSFGSTSHGGGRVISRQRALKSNGIEIRAASKETIIEEAPETYKDIEEVVATCETVGLSKKVARLLPVGVIKG